MAFSVCPLSFEVWGTNTYFIFWIVKLSFGLYRWLLEIHLSQKLSKLLNLSWTRKRTFLNNNVVYIEMVLLHIFNIEPLMNLIAVSTCLSLLHFYGWLWFATGRNIWKALRNQISQLVFPINTIPGQMVTWPVHEHKERMGLTAFRVCSLTLDSSPARI